MRLFLFLLIFPAYSALFAQNNLQAVSYYQLIKNEQENIGKEIYYFKNSVSDLNLKLLHFQIQKSITTVESVPAYNNEEAFKKATVALFNYFLMVSDNQYKQLLKYVEDPNMDNKEYKTKLQTLFKDISAKEKPYDEKFYLAEDEYIKKYSIKREN